MQSSASTVPTAAGSNYPSPGSAANDMEMGGGGGGGGGGLPIQQLESGVHQFIRVDGKLILAKVMREMGCPVEPVYSLLEDGDFGLKLCIQLDLSSMPYTNSEMGSYPVIQGETYFGQEVAERDAIVKAFNLLRDNYMVTVVDFSSRAIRRMSDCGTHELLVTALGHLKNALLNWDMLAKKCDKFADDLKSKEFSDLFAGKHSPSGLVYVMLGEYLDSTLKNLSEKADEVRSDLTGIESGRRNCEKKMEKNAQTSPPTAHMRQVVLPSKDLLKYVVDYFSLNSPEYISTQEPTGVVCSRVHLEFPYMEDFQFGGKICIRGEAYTSAEADEEAAFEALLFIERHFNTTVMDYNYTARRNATKSQKKLIFLLSSTLEMGHYVNMMFGEMRAAIEGHRQRFSYDPNEIFTGNLSVGQTKAYVYCRDVVSQIDACFADCYKACEPSFEAMHQIGWKLAVTKGKLGM